MKLLGVKSQPTFSKNTPLKQQEVKEAMIKHYVLPIVMLMKCVLPYSEQAIKTSK